MTSNTVMWSAVIGFFLPPIIAIIQQPRWPSWSRAVVGFILAVLVSFGTMYYAGTLVLTGPNALPLSFNALIVLTVSIATFKGFWTPTTVVPKIEAITSPKSSSTASAP